MSTPSTVTIERLRFAWPGGGVVLSLDSLALRTGERLFIKGASGSGKSTLLSLVAGITQAERGAVHVLGRDMAEMSGSRRDRFRADHMGIIFQQFNLLPYLSVVENVLLPCRFSPRRRANAEEKGGIEAEACRLLDHLDIGPDLRGRAVADLSVGQQQRVAAARALMGSPELVIADEPTSALDANRRNDFLRLLFHECNARNASLLFVSHDAALEKEFERALHLDEQGGQQ